MSARPCFISPCMKIQSLKWWFNAVLCHDYTFAHLGGGGAGGEKIENTRIKMQQWKSDTEHQIKQLCEKRFLNQLFPFSVFKVKICAHLVLTPLRRWVLLRKRPLRKPGAYLSFSHRFTCVFQTSADRFLSVLRWWCSAVVCIGEISQLIVKHSKNDQLTL